MRTINGPVGLALLGAGLGLLAAGCGPAAGVRTSPVRGKVVVRNGDVGHLVGGYVRLQSVADPKVRAVGSIEEGGEFVLGTFVDNRPVGGVIEGEYLALVEPPGADEGEGEGPPPPTKGQLLPKYRSFKTSGLRYTIGPGENAITVEVEARK